MPLTTNPSDSPTPSAPNPHLTICKACGAQIAKNAKVCPACGAKNPKPIYKKWWFWLIIILVIGIAGGTSKQDTPSASGPSRAQNPPPASRPSPSSSSPSESSISSAPEEPTNIFYPGDVLETSRLKITYQECDSDWRGYNQFMTPQSGNKVVRAYFIFENTGDIDQFCSGFEFSCYADGVSSSSFLWAADDNLSSANLSPGRKLQGYVYFEVPTDAEEIELEYETSFWTQDKAIFIVE